MGVTDPVCEQVAELQQMLGEGPCLDAAAFAARRQARGLGRGPGRNPGNHDREPGPSCEVLRFRVGPR
jgi:hypothetical protein